MTTGSIRHTGASICTSAQHFERLNQGTCERHDNTVADSPGKHGGAQDNDEKRTQRTDAASILIHVATSFQQSTPAIAKRYSATYETMHFQGQLARKPIPLNNTKQIPDPFWTVRTGSPTRKTT